MSSDQILAIARELKRIKVITEQNKRNIESLKEEFSTEIKQLKRLVNDKIDDAEDRILESQAQQQNMQIVKASNEVKKQVMSIIDNDLGPKVERTINYMKYQMQDGDELVTEYRKRVMDVYSDDKVKKITQGEQAKVDFQRNTFAFTDDD